MSGLAVRKPIIVDSTARSRGAASKKSECRGELDGVEVVDDAVDETDGSVGGVVDDTVFPSGMTVDEAGRASLFVRR